MEEENSNDVVLIENTEDEDSTPFNLSETRPLMSLFERLISNSKSNTVLTNEQILSILDKEFNIDVKTLHELEIDIYINIVKRFLKDWPQWDVFDRVLNKLKRKSDQAEIKMILEKKYKDLKEYLQTMIQAATPLAQDSVRKLKTESPITSTATEPNNIVLEIYCTRRMLNTFIYNKPNPKENDSLFHLVEFEPYKLGASPSYTFRSILHWYGVRLTIELPSLQYTRYTAHQLNHVLVNETNGLRKFNTELDTNVYMKSSKSITNSAVIAVMKTRLNDIVKRYNQRIEYDMVKEIIDVVKSDFEFDSDTVEVPGSYRQHSSRYPYVRRLYRQVDDGPPSNHNLYIEETLTPIQDWQIGRFVNMEILKLPPLNTWLKLECGECKQKFNGAEFLTLLRDHFKVYHIDEPDWTCTNCNKSFKMAELTNHAWKHDC